jgi:hypothetical protein
LEDAVFSFAGVEEEADFVEEVVEVGFGSGLGVVGVFAAFGCVCLAVGDTAGFAWLLAGAFVALEGCGGSAWLWCGLAFDGPARWALFAVFVVASACCCGAAG